MGCEVCLSVARNASRNDSRSSAIMDSISRVCMKANVASFRFASVPGHWLQITQPNACVKSRRPQVVLVFILLAHLSSMYMLYSVVGMFAKCCALHRLQVVDRREQRRRLHVLPSQVIVRDRVYRFAVGGGCGAELSWADLHRCR